MDTRMVVEKKINNYHPKGGLDKFALIILDLLSINHYLVRSHVERVALTAEVVAKKLKKDAKAAFFAGIFHDIGKLVYPHNLFDGHNINEKEYQEVKKHALAGYKALMPGFLFIALCTGLHHAMHEKGYGLNVKDFPRFLGPKTVKKICEIATIISICDDIDASLHRKTIIKDQSADGYNLNERLVKKFPDDIQVVGLALKEARKPTWR